MTEYKIRYTPEAMRDMDEIFMQSILKCIRHSIAYMIVI